jgi:2-methylcitrate dehydratase PrpD
MNMYYGLSVMALRKEVSAADYSDTAISDPQVLAFIPRNTIEEDSELESKGAAFRHAARLRVLTMDGRTLTREVLHRRGSPESPVERAEIERKFCSNVDGLLEPGTRDRLIELCASIETLPLVAAINDIVSAPPSTQPALSGVSAVEARWACPDN